MGPALMQAAGGMAAGDIDDDGACDVLIGGIDGKLTLVLNDSLGSRKPQDNPTSQQAALLATGIVGISVRGAIGVLGASVSIADADGHIVGRRVIGSQALTGCRGPDDVCLAVRQSGKHTLAVRFSDGVERRVAIDVPAGKHLKVVIDRAAAPAVSQPASSPAP